MSESILKALMQLFAVITKPESNVNERQLIVKSFLKEQLNKELVEEYLKVFDSFYELHQRKQSSKSRRRKRTAASSVKILMICNAINKELTQKQKLVVIIRLLEFIKSDIEISEQELEFVATVADSFNIPLNEFENIKTFVLYSSKTILDSDKVLIIDSNHEFTHPQIKHINSYFLSGQIIIYNISFANMQIFTFIGEKELYLNGQLLSEYKIHILTAGSSIRNSKIKPIYYSDIISTFNIDKIKSKVVFEANNITYKFKNGVFGIHKMSFIERSGKLIGIMGASGSGKSTLLNVLNGTYKPTNGEILINGIDIYKESTKIEGIIGYVSQDDLLMEELTVFQNLYYNAKLCFDGFSEFQILRRVFKLLSNLGLYDIKDMKVGNPLNKKISGGQRKRLNIALELIREPAVLFLDEPTSGLSSRDSENILDLLKELSHKGKLVFVVIHQPSSDIFKMFDKLLIMDQGGYMIYNGDPVDSIVYFKSRIRQADWNESECSICGNVNPEQIFNIVEGQILDEYGNLTKTRKTSSVEWYEHYNDFFEKKNKKSILVRRIPNITFKVPNRLKQFKVFIVRDVLSKLTNKQYLLINLLEAPVLAFLLSFIIKYYNVDIENTLGYTLYKNSNLPVFIFMSVIVGIFIGLTGSAQEIIKDRLILKREEFLNLSRFSYLTSKVSILFAISAFQSLTFVLVGNWIMEIKGMYWQYWLVLFSTWASSNMAGLNISDGFKTSITIYIIIPFLVIPQIILSGIIVKFDKLNPLISSPNEIPWYGEMMTSRWAYEALSVYQFKNNKFEKRLYKYDKKKSISDYKKNYWLVSLENKITDYERNYKKPEKKEQLIRGFELLRNEISKELKINPKVKLNISVDSLYIDKLSKKSIPIIKQYFSNLNIYYMNLYNVVDNGRDMVITKLQKNKELREEYKMTKMRYHNEALEKFVTNQDELEKIVEYESNLYQKTSPIFYDPVSYFIKAHFYAPRKRIFGKFISTYAVNVIVIWIMTLFLFVTLYFSVLRKLLGFSTYVQEFIQRKKK